MSVRVFFGGSFAPPHIGHHQILSRLILDPEVEHVHLVPTGVNPLKPEANHFNDVERGLLVSAWMEDLKRKQSQNCCKVVLETLELESGKSAYTVDSLRTLRERHVDSKWALVIGADLLSQLSRWKSVLEMLSMVEAVWVFRRGGFPFGPQEIPQSLRSVCMWRLFPDPIEWISSTDIRELDIRSDATQVKLRSYLLDNVFEVVSGLLQQKNQE